MNGRIGTALTLWVLCSSAVWGQGYVIRGNQIVVEGRHLKTWEFPVGTVEFFAPANAARPNFVAKDIDATQDIVEHLRRNPPKGVKAEDVALLDAVRAGTNAAGVANLLRRRSDLVLAARPGPATARLVVRVGSRAGRVRDSYPPDLCG